MSLTCNSRGGVSKSQVKLSRANWAASFRRSDRAQIKIAPDGEAMLAPVAHLSPGSGYREFRSNGRKMFGFGHNGHVLGLRGGARWLITSASTFFSHRAKGIATNTVVIGPGEAPPGAVKNRKFS